MRKYLYVLFFYIIFFGITNNTGAQTMDNPFFKEWTTPFQTPPFNDIKLEHYMPAYEAGIKEQKSEIEAIANNKEKPTFLNTIEAMEKSGKLLSKVNRVFGALNSSINNEEMQKIAEKSASLLAKHNDDIYFNQELFKRVKTLYNERTKLKLNEEQATVLENYYLDFIIGGSNLKPKEKERFRQINEELSLLTLKFGDNVRKENSKFLLIVDKKEDLAGLTDDQISSASAKAKEKGMEGKWIFTIDKPTLLPFLELSQNRSLREKMYKAYMNRGNNNDELDNKKTFSKIISLRVEKAHLLGYKNYADVVLQRKMAKTPDAAIKFLNDMWKPTMKKAKLEVADMQKIIVKEGGKFKLQPWDWWFYAAKVKKDKYDLNEEMIRPYFQMENVVKGVFAVATNLYGIKFVERNDIQIYHPEVKVYEVLEADGKHLGVFYTDYFPRESKTSGAWCGSFRDESNINGNLLTPVVYNVGNFNKPTSDKPALLSVDDVTTMFHEFGHALNALFQNVTYPYSGNVPTDFVELPSQVMENWALQPDVLKMYAKHYKTGEIIPDELIKKIANAKHFNQGFETGEYIAASILDFDWHTISETKEQNVNKVEKASIKKMKLIPEILPRYMTTNFIHIASHGYEAGYYSYLWSAVLDADAFEAFMEKGLFDKKTADSFRKNVLSVGASGDLMKFYKTFRGRGPKVDALLKSRGLI